MKKINKYIYILKELFIKLIRFFFSYLNGGQNCIICGQTTYFLPLCKNCIENHFNVKETLLLNRCEICGKKLISTTKICMNCKEKPLFRNTDKIIPLFSYRLWNKELLFMWKINEVRNISYFFAAIVNKALTILNYTIIVPVPPRKGKIKKKGWDQIDELCKILSKKYDYTVLRLLERISVEEQKKLNREQRLEKIKSAYSQISNEKLEKELIKNQGILPKSVCLIDDVCTTGATVQCCSEILKNIGIKEVNIITLFIVD